MSELGWRDCEKGVVRDSMSVSNGKGTWLVGECAGVSRGSGKERKGGVGFGGLTVSLGPAATSCYSERVRFRDEYMWGLGFDCEPGQSCLVLLWRVSMIDWAIVNY